MITNARTKSLRSRVLRLAFLPTMVVIGWNCAPRIANTSQPLPVDVHMRLLIHTPPVVAALDQ